MAGNKAAQERAARKQAEVETRKQQERVARREAHRASSIAGMAKAAAATSTDPTPHPSLTPPPPSPTFSEVIARSGLLENISTATRRIINETGKQAEQYGRLSLKVLPSCHDCNAVKGCCKITTTMYLYEAVPVAARLIREGRDTTELRQQLEAAAIAMENTPRDKLKFERPCVFLDSEERCTIYEDRPSECGTTFVFSDPTLCSSKDSGARVQKFRAMLQEMGPPGFEQRFLADVGLRRTDHPYLGALPRMVLLCLQVWDRADFVDFLSEHGRRAAHKFARVIGFQVPR